MHHRLLTVALALALPALAACGDAAPPGPTGIAPPALSHTLSPTVCDPAGIRGSAAELLQTTDLKSRFLPDYNRAEDVRRTQGVDAAYPLYFDLIAFVLDRFEEDRLTLARTSAEAQASVNSLVGSLLACVEVAYPSGLDLILGRIGAGDPHYAICPAITLGAPQITCVVPSGGAAIWLPQGFLARAALILMEPAFNAEGQFEEVYGTTWSGVWRIRIVPPDAQAYYAYDPPPPSAPSASVAVCPLVRYADFHAELENQMRLAQAGEGAFEGDLALLDPSALASSLLGDCSTYRASPPPSPLGAVASGGASFGALDGLLARREMRTLRSAAGRALSHLFDVRPLYAWDGGIGGGTKRITSRFAGVEQQGLYLRTEDPTTGEVETLALATQDSRVLYASQTEFGMLMPGGACTWASSHRRVTATADADSSWKATFTTSRSTGDATVTATCTRDAAVHTASVLVTVTRP